MAYTPPVLKVHTNPNNFGPLVNDSNRIGMTGYTGNIMQTIDATGTPVTSPISVNTTQTLVVPQNAVAIVITPVTNPVQVSEDSTQTAYFAVPAGTVWQFDVSRQQNVYLKTGGATTVSFYFVMV